LKDSTIMESVPHDHIQLRLAAEAAKPTLAKLREERERLIPRLRDIDQSMQLLQGVIDAWERIDRRNDPLVVQLQRIDQELGATSGARPNDTRNAYKGVERRSSPRPNLVARPLSTLSGVPIDMDPGAAPAAPAGAMVRGVMLERARRILQASMARRPE
jgi:hypothetical protein